MAQKKGKKQVTLISGLENFSTLGLLYWIIRELMNG